MERGTVRQTFISAPFSFRSFEVFHFFTSQSLQSFSKFLKQLSQIFKLQRQHISRPIKAFRRGSRTRSKMPVFGARMVCETANYKYIEERDRQFAERENKLAR